MFFGCLFQVRFLIVLGSVLGSILEPFGLPNGVYVEWFGGSIFGIVFVMVFSVAGWLAQAPHDLRQRGWGVVTRPSRGPTNNKTDSR